MPVAAAVRASEIAALRALLQTLLPPEGAPRPALAEQRAGYDGMGLSQGLPEGAVVEDVRIGSLPAERVRTPGADGSRALLYLHGGGWVLWGGLLCGVVGQSGPKMPKLEGDGLVRRGVTLTGSLAASNTIS